MNKKIRLLAPKSLPVAAASASNKVSGQSPVIAYTGDGKGKTSAGIGLVCRALGAGKKVAFIQFIKQWRVSEDEFFDAVAPVFGENLTLYKGGLGFFEAGAMSAKGVSKAEHVTMARKTYDYVLREAVSGDYDVSGCDEINNAVHDGLLSIRDIDELIEKRSSKTTLCLTGRNFPAKLKAKADIISDIQKVKHHYDDGAIAQKGLDY